MWITIVLFGAFAPSFIDLLRLWDLQEFHYFGILTTFAALAYRVAHPRPPTIWERVVAVILFSMAILWSLDTAFGYLFDIQINWPYWGIIEFILLFLVFLNSFIQGCTEKTGCFVYVRKPLTFQDLLATIFGGCLVTTAIEFEGKFYGFRKSKLIELTDFDKTKYERRNAPITFGEKIVANLGKPWRPWRNCVLIVWR